MPGSFTTLFLLLDAALLVAWRRYSGSRRKLAAVTVFCLLVQLYCTPAVCRLPALWLEGRFPRLESRPDGARAIVVLSGSIRRPDTPGQEALPGEGAIFRCVRAAELYREGEPCPVFASGGVSPTFPDETAAKIMGRFMVHLGVAESDLVLEPDSMTTHENAVQTARLLKDRKIDNVLLVTDGLHLYRATLCFQREGLQVIPAGCAYRVQGGIEADDLLPHVSGAVTMNATLHELGGLIWYWLRGYL
jgi:uncharacterized SAM-binding protein YcdF (DUF218 family)